VIPRYFEAGVEPVDAFLTMITTFNSSGVLFGISAWVLMVVLGLTSFFRDKLGMNYKTWRVFHGILSIVFFIVACLHVLNLGSHIDIPMSLFIVITGLAGVLLLLKMYIFKPKTVKSSR
jgi:DMSO/TMAO reductase YedYZ heme-binding membrane subunit